MRDRVMTEPKQKPTSFANTKPVGSLAVQSRELKASENQCSAASAGTGWESSAAAATNTLTVIGFDTRKQNEPDTHPNMHTAQLWRHSNEKIKYCSRVHTHLRQTRAHFRAKDSRTSKH